MSREILFRGKVNNPRDLEWPQEHVDGWVEGDLQQDRDLKSMFINGWNYYYDGQLEREPFECSVDPKTVGQYTGLTDKNGKKIFEGDICKIINFKIDGIVDGNFIVVFDKKTAHYLFRGEGLCIAFDIILHYNVEVIGNIYDNPELLEGEE